MTTKKDGIGENAWVLDLEDIEKDTSRLIRKARFSERKSLSDKNSFAKGDVLYGKLRPYLNKVLVADDDGFCTTEILPFKCYGPSDSHYFKIALKSPYFLSYVNAKSYGMKMPRLGTEDGRHALFPLPPIEEQSRIVAKFDDLMTLCDQLEARQGDADSAHAQLVQVLLDSLTQTADAEDFAANWRRITEHFPTLFTTESSINALQQALLQLAVMGKLVTQDSRDEPAWELLNRTDQGNVSLLENGRVKAIRSLAEVGERSAPFERPNGWVWCTLAQLLPDFQNGASSRGDSDGVIITVLRLADIKSGEISLEETRSLNLEAEAITKYALRPGDILVIRVNGSADLVGRFIVCRDSIQAIPCDHFIRMRISSDVVNPAYLKIVGDSELVRRAISVMFVSTAGQKTVNQGHVGSLLIPLPPLAEQRRIVEVVDQLMALCNQLKARINQAHQLHEHLANALVEQTVA